MKLNFSKSLLAASWAVILLTVIVFGTSHKTSRASEIDNFVSAPFQNLIHLTTSESEIPRKKVSPTELQCMAKNIYYEAGSESLLGKMAVGQVVLNRMANSSYPTTVCGVVNERSKDAAICQFSWVCNPNLPGVNMSSQAWRHSYDVALNLLSINTPIKDITEGATHFHAVYVKPAWAATKKKIVTIDDHSFYK